MDLEYAGLKLSIPDDVYPPAEDSFMLADAAKSVHGKVLEIGCGSGIASLACAKANPKTRVLGVDINSEAVKCARENAKRNGIANAEFIVSDFFSNVPKPANDALGFDAILFNPPYLPTEYNEKLEGPLNEAFDGGNDGRKMLDPFLDRFDPYLKPGGTLLLVQSSLNGPKKTKTKLERLGYKVGIASRQDFFFESVFIYQAVKPSMARK